jgi:hypothetical protein
MKQIFSFITAIMIGSSAFAQIPNASFETWTSTGGYDVPVGWDQLNAATATTSTYTCFQGTPGNPGSTFLQLTSKTVTGMGVVPGIACSGLLDQTSLANVQPRSGFASTVRPASLTGNWQYMAYGADQGHIMVLLSKWNNTTSMRDTVAFTDYRLPWMVMSWASFNIPISYISGAVPDSAMIVLSASGSTPVNSSFLSIDNLAFSGTVPTGVATYAPAATLSIYPNPASVNTSIVYDSPSGGTIDVKIADVRGRIIETFAKKTHAGINNVPLDVSAYAKGIYVVKVVADENTCVQKLVVE